MRACAATRARAIPRARRLGRSKAPSQRPRPCRSHPSARPRAAAPPRRGSRSHLRQERTRAAHGPMTHRRRAPPRRPPTGPGHAICTGPAAARHAWRSSLQAPPGTSRQPRSAARAPRHAHWTGKPSVRRMRTSQRTTQMRARGTWTRRAAPRCQRRRLAPPRHRPRRTLVAAATVHTTKVRAARMWPRVRSICEIRTRMGPRPLQGTISLPWQEQ